MTATCSGQTASENRISQFLETEMRTERVPGLALATEDHGKFQEHTYGLASIELGSPVTRKTVFDSGSVAKEFVAVATMMLVERHQLDLDDSITKYLPGAPESWKAVKLKHLLSHTSGLGDFSSVALTARGAPFDYQKDLSQDELLQKLYALPTVFAPATQWRYCNTNFALLGVVLEKVSGRSWGQLLKELIFSPLGMTSARVVNEHELVPHRASGYLLENDAWKNQRWTAPTWNALADGNVELSLADLERWNAALLARKLLKAKSLEKMWTVFLLADGKANPGSYGLGFFVNSVNGHRLIDHEGAWQGFSTYSGVYVDDGLAVAVLSNLETPPARPRDFGLGALGLLKPDVQPQDVLSIFDPDPALTAILRQRVGDFIQGKPKPQDYAPEMHSDPAEDAQLQAMFRAQGPSQASYW